MWIKKVNKMKDDKKKDRETLGEFPKLFWPIYFF